jgi:cell division protein ZapA
MGQVSAKINGRTYRFSCADGDEGRLKLLAEYLRERVDGVINDFGQVGEDRLLAMAALLIADELFDAREALKKSGK